MDLKEINILNAEDIERHWYYLAKAMAVERLLSLCNYESPSIILDVGAGSGFFSRKLLSATSAKEVWCVDINYEDDFYVIEAGKPIHFRRSIDAVNADLVLMMDVLEHIDDDIDFLRNYVNKVPSGARFLISVPAFQFLWSGHDVFLEHKRRYCLSQLEDVVRQAGLRVQHSAYYFAFVFPIAAATRLVSNVIRHLQNKVEVRSQLSQHHPIVNEILAKICAIELPLLAYNRLVGLTIFCIAQKP
jgi:SAM-dependent methyltransferase